ncbi:ABC transporter permease [Micromonospora sp. NPDC048830]|uniref:ABC transporter permease n=1 Tax=Micromonospora sp. NPDC048830 TaxID=3364257 RepID=UPI00371F9C93
MAIVDRQVAGGVERSRRAPRLPRLGVGGYLGLGVLLLLTVVAVLAPAIAPHDPVRPASGASLAAPSGDFWLGTDLYSRDVLSRLIYGARVSIGVGVTVTAVVFVLGAALGLVSAYFGTWLDTVIGRLTDTLMAVPGILLAITIIAVLGSGVVNVVIALSLTYLPEMVRVVRGQALSVRRRTHVRAATALGASHRRIMVGHIAPYVLGPAIVQATFVFAHAMLYESALSFLGLGIQPPNPTWGNIIADALPYISSAPLQIVFPSLVISGAVLAVNLLGDSLRDLIDPEGSVPR